MKNSFVFRHNTMNPGFQNSLLAMLFIKELQQKTGSIVIDSQQLKSFITNLFKQ